MVTLEGCCRPASNENVRSRPPVPVDLHVLVVPRDLQGVAAAQRSLHDLHPAAAVRLVTSGPAPGGLTEGVVADAVGVDVLARLHTDRTLPRAVERGVDHARQGEPAGGV